MLTHIISPNFLYQAKAFDKKTSVLAYLVKLIKKNDPDLLKFKDDVNSVEKAENVMLDALQADLKQLIGELDTVKQASKKAGDSVRGEDGKLINPQMKKTLRELKEQKTHVREVSGVKFYNQLVHDIELTHMELFAIHSEQIVVTASKKVDQTKENFVSALHYFGEDEKMTTSDFFGTLKKFFIAFDSSRDQVERLEEIKVSYLELRSNFNAPYVSQSIYQKQDPRRKTCCKGKGKRTKNETNIKGKS